MSTFTWIPDYQASVEHSPSVTKAMFGDGYTQRTQNGINYDLKKWNLQFSNREMTEGNAIDDFFKTQGAATSFDWVDPDGETKTYVCENWIKTYPDWGVITINCSFVEEP